jgi:hypothetical protein
MPRRRPFRNWFHIWRNRVVKGLRHFGGESHTLRRQTAQVYESNSSVVSLKFLSQFDETKWFEQHPSGAKAQLIFRRLRHD